MEGLSRVLQQPSAALDRESLRMPIGNESVPVGFLELSLLSDAGDAAVKTARNAFILAAIGATVAAFLMSMFIGRRLTRPLLQLTSAVKSVGEGQWESRVPEYGDDEIGQLSAQFNRMASSLEQSYRELTQERDTLRQFIQDASHELRTPTTALSTFNELMLRQSNGLDERFIDFLSESQIQIKKLNWIITNLLNLSRLEGGIAALHVDNHDPAEIMQGVIKQHQHSVLKKGIEINLDITESPDWIRCDRGFIETALSNLLDNALLYSPENSTINVTVKQKKTGGDKGFCLFIIEDRGGGISENELPHIFKRFYRIPGSKGKGSGLGLSIVKGIADSHGGSIEVSSVVGKGSSFTLSIP
jgi:signal transduction histidine kinase